jgi:hypothetical protein
MLTSLAIHLRFHCLEGSGVEVAVGELNAPNCFPHAPALPRPRKRVQAVQVQAA